MIIWGKIIGFCLGWLTLGPIGAVIGLVLGAAFDRGLRLNLYRMYPPKDEPSDSARSQRQQHFQQAFQQAWEQFAREQQRWHQQGTQQGQQHWQPHTDVQPDALKAAYQTLEVTPGAPPDEVKSAYRRLMNQYHPDKLVSKGLPEDMLTFAKEKTQQIRTAYDLIRQTQGFR